MVETLEEARISELEAKLQFLVDYLDIMSLLEEHSFTFPDGDTWNSRAGENVKGEK